MENSERLTVDAGVAFRLMGMSKNTGYSLIQRGEFPCAVIRAGRRILISKVSLARLLGQAENKTESESR